MKFFVRHQKSVECINLSPDETRHLNFTELKSKMEALETILSVEDDDFYLIDSNRIKMHEYQTWLLLAAIIPQNTDF